MFYIVIDFLNINLKFYMKLRTAIWAPSKKKMSTRCEIKLFLMPLSIKNCFFKKEIQNIADAQQVSWCLLSF